MKFRKRLLGSKVLEAELHQAEEEFRRAQEDRNVATAATGERESVYVYTQKVLQRSQQRGDASIVLDVLPDRPIPAIVSFVSPTAQFTPKEVETRADVKSSCFGSKFKLIPPFSSNMRTGQRPGYRCGLCETRTYFRMAAALRSSFPDLIPGTVK
jgi:hypothetical protein